MTQRETAHAPVSTTEQPADAALLAERWARMTLDLTTSVRDMPSAAIARPPSKRAAEVLAVSLAERWFL
ncbi:hypothetical protein [Nocardia arizonensis]|uniref:hypothetical protein n=1 Tax=Nocardia arizonensis TaxID=1141647 RepID=UPI001EF47E31|nr:hypothetical protein [Nocardia arizonensis]